MGEAAPQEAAVVDMAHYLRDTIAEIDAMTAGWQAQRAALAARLVAMEAATDPQVLEAARDYEARVAEDRPYEGAEDARSVIAEAYRRYVP